MSASKFFSVAFLLADAHNLQTGLMKIILISYCQIGKGLHCQASEPAS